MPRFVEDVGPKNAKIIIVGEAPGSHEDRTGRPFEGPAGYLLTKVLNSVGLDRKQVYITNVYPYRPPKNDLSVIPKDELDTWIDELHKRMAALDDPWVIVPMGNTALKALTGKKGITKHRGSILQYKDVHSREIKCIPTIHPAATFREQWYERPFRLDWKRIKEDSAFRELRLPERVHVTGRDLDAYEDFYNEAKEKATILAIDIETTPDIILCVGFSFDKGYSITIPVDTPGYQENHGAVRQAWDIVRRLCELPCEKTLQNGSYDTFRLRHYHIGVRNYKWDTLALHHALDASDAHDLAYMASVDTRQPYWKDEAKDPDEAAKYVSDIDALWVYNGIDCCVQRELTDIYVERIRQAGKADFYERHYRRMFAPILEMMLHGIKVNNKARSLKHAELQAACFEMHDKLTAIAGEPLYGKKDLSTKKLAKFLYETLRLPKQIERKTGKVTTKEVVVRKMMLKYPDKLKVPGQLILDVRRKTQLGKFCEAKRLDPDGRMRSTFKVTTEAGRLASSKSPTGTGSNLQNQDREIRNIFVPDKGHIFLEVDGAQVENRIVNVLTGDPALIKRALAKPWEYDEHMDNAIAIFGKPADKISKMERYLGKKTVHGAQRGLRGLRMSEELLKDGYVYTPAECDKLIDTYLQKSPAIIKWHRSVRATVLQHRCVVNSWGRELKFELERMSDDLYRRAYSFYPQSECADWMNQFGFIPLSLYLKATKMQSKISIHGHDSLLISCLPDEAWEVVTFVVSSLERTRRINGVDLMIPCGIKVGRTWAGDHEWKRMPERDEFEERVNELCER